ncbi:MAG TPA: prenyltransferase/squalene oxidase repeat-containing protein [Gemmataceae bacterium]|jgi:hypothetical protein
MRTGVIAVAVWLVGGLPLVAQAPNTDTASIKFLTGLRGEDGGYAPAPARPGTPLRSSLRATTSALRAIKYLGGRPEDTAATAKFAERCYDKSIGGFADYPGEAPTVSTTAVGAMAAVELKLPPDLYRDGVTRYLTEHAKTMEDIRIAAATFESFGTRAPKADDWLRQIAATRNPDGTYGSGPGLARATGGTAAMILRLGGTLEHRDAVLKAMRDGQRPDGGYGTAEREGSDLESTYRVVRGFVMLKERPADVAKLRAFIGKCRSADGGYGVMPGQPPTAAGTYFAAILLHWLDGR